MGEQVIYDWLPWKRGYRESSNGSYLGTFPYIPSEERRKDFLYSQPLIYASERLISIKSKSSIISNWDEVDGITICLPLGYASVKNMTDRIAIGKVVRITRTTMEDCFYHVKAVRSHYVLSGIIQAWFTAKELGIKFDELWISKLDISDKKHSGLSLIISRKIEGGADWIKRFNSSLGKLRENGTVNKIIHKHLGNDFPVYLLN